MSSERSMEDADLSTDGDFTDASTASLAGSVRDGDEYNVESFSEASDEESINAGNQWTALFRPKKRSKQPGLRSVSYGKSNTMPGKTMRTLCEKRANFATTPKGILELKKLEKQAIKGTEMNINWLEQELDHFTALGIKARTRRRAPLEPVG